MAEIGPNTRLKVSPFYQSTLQEGVAGFSPYNRMLMPVSYGDPAAEYARLMGGVSQWDVAVERQVQLKGPDAARLAQILSVRDLSGLRENQGKYVPMCDHRGTLINDPVVLQLEDDLIWFSIADKDILMWARCVAAERGLAVDLSEPDVSPLQLQGPKSGDIMRALFGDDISSLRYYWLREMNLDGIPLVVSRTGWSSELGYEIYLRDGARGDELWEKIMAVGAPLGLHPGHTSSIRRIEGAMLSYHADADIHTNPYELGLDRLVNLEMNSDFIGKDALRTIRDNGVSRKQVGLRIEGEALKGPNTTFWTVQEEGQIVGKVTSAVYSPRLEQNIALAMVGVNHAATGTPLVVNTASGTRAATVVEKPFFDPKKRITAA